jgi:hypothetical protein
VVVTIFAAIVAAWSLGVIAPLIPAGDWHVFPSRLFVSVAVAVADLVAAQARPPSVG